MKTLFSKGAEWKKSVLTVFVSVAVSWGIASQAAAAAVLLGEWNQIFQGSTLGEGPITQARFDLQYGLPRFDPPLCVGCNLNYLILTGPAVTTTIRRDFAAADFPDFVNILTDGVNDLLGARTALVGSGGSGADGTNSELERLLFPTVESWDPNLIRLNAVFAKDQDRYRLDVLVLYSQ